jgi:hypothetical protein
MPKHLLYYFLKSLSSFYFLLFPPFFCSFLSESLQVCGASLRVLMPTAPLLEQQCFKAPATGYGKGEAGQARLFANKNSKKQQNWQNKLLAKLVKGC